MSEPKKLKMDLINTLGEHEEVVMTGDEPSLLDSSLDTSSLDTSSSSRIQSSPSSGNNSDFLCDAIIGCAIRTPPVPPSSLSFNACGDDGVFDETEPNEVSSSHKPTLIYHINQLDDYSLMMVFSKLTIVERIAVKSTCRKWSHIIDKLFQAQTSIGLTMSYANCPNVTHHVSSKECIGKLFERSLLPGEHPRTQECFIPSETLSMLLEKCSNLKCLILQNCIFRRDVIDVFTKHTSIFLEHIDFSFSSCFVNDIIKCVTHKTGNTLKHVILKNNNLNEDVLAQVINNCKELELLILDNNEDLSGECFRDLAESIKHLSLLGCPNIQTEGINALVSGNGKNLTHLKLDKSITSANLLEITTNMTQIRVLEMEGFNTEVPNVYNCISHLTHLEELILTMPRITFDVPLLQIIMNCHQLKKIKIEGAIISNSPVIYASRHCPLIEQISITPARDFTNNLITDDCVMALAEMSNLKALALSDSKVTDAITHVIMTSPKLSFIELDGCKSITIATLNACMEKAISKPNEKFMLFISRTNILKPIQTIPTNLNVFPSPNWGSI